MSVVLEMLAANSDRPIMNQGVPRPARKYEPALPLFPFRSPHHTMKTRYRTMMMMSMRPIPLTCIIMWF